MIDTAAAFIGGCQLPCASVELDDEQVARPRPDHLAVQTLPAKWAAGGAGVPGFGAVALADAAVPRGGRGLSAPRRVWSKNKNTGMLT